NQQACPNTRSEVINSLHFPRMIGSPVLCPSSFSFPLLCNHHFLFPYYAIIIFFSLIMQSSFSFPLLCNFPVGKIEDKDLPSPVLSSLTSLSPTPTFVLLPLLSPSSLPCLFILFRVIALHDLLASLLS